MTEAVHLVTGIKERKHLVLLTAFYRLPAKEGSKEAFYTKEEIISKTKGISSVLGARYSEVTLKQAFSTVSNNQISSTLDERIMGTGYSTQ